MGWIVALLFIIGMETVGIVSAWWSGTAGSAWYAQLAKPVWQPPSWLFGPVWTLLYALMGVCAYRLYSAPPSIARSIALWLFGIQLALNFLWSPIFFKHHMIGLALVDIVLLLALLITTMLFAWQVDRRAALLLVPYVLWVGFASALNHAIWILN